MSILLAFRSISSDSDPGGLSLRGRFSGDRGRVSGIMVGAGCIKASRDAWPQPVAAMRGGHGGDGRICRFRDHRGGGGRGRLWSKTELGRINSSANEAEGRSSGNVLRRFLARSMVGGDSSLRKTWGGGAKGSLRRAATHVLRAGNGLYIPLPLFTLAACE